MEIDVTSMLTALRDGRRTQLSDLATSDTPRTPGIYALWHSEGCSTSGSPGRILPRRQIRRRLA